MALDGKVDFVRKTNPWGSGEDEKAGKDKADKPLTADDPEPDLLARPPSPEFAMHKLIDIVKRRQRAGKRGAKR